MYRMLKEWTRLVLALSVALGHSSCRNDSPGPGGETAPDQPASARTSVPASGGVDKISGSVDDLSKIVKLPVRPTSALWQKSRLGTNKHPEVPGPTDYKLTAVLQFSDADANQITSLASQLAPPASGGAEPADWFPAELKNRVTKDEDGYAIVPGTRLRPDAFFHAPFLKGTLTRVDKTNYFVLRLITT